MRFQADYSGQRSHALVPGAQALIGALGKPVTWLKPVRG